MNALGHCASFPPGLSLEQKWDFLKPEIEELYVERGLTVRKVGEHVKERYNFNANFMNWNVPYKPSKAPIIELGNHPSPFPPQGSTPSDVSFGSPPAPQAGIHYGLTTSLSSALQKKNSVDRARLFLDGKFPNIVKSMTQKEQMTMSTWLYQLWFFSFKTAKYWGRGPRHWIADMLGFRKNEAANFPTPASQNSPAALSPLTTQQHSPSAREVGATNTVEPPSHLCRWSIHIAQEDYSPLEDPESEIGTPLDVSDPTTYKPWSGSDSLNASYPNTLRDALESNDFSSFHSDQLPVAVPPLLQKAVREEGDLISESLAFAIMSRNVEMVESFCYKYEWSFEKDMLKTVFQSIDAFHLAATYLDGAKSCCLIMNELNGMVPLNRYYINSLGHTVLDALMITIIKSHTSCKPVSVDDVFRGTHRFPGDEMDICGRWDADSNCVRSLLLQGKHHIPFHWKHKFCHTSAQAICDSITTIWGAWSAPSINTLSGLFIRRCLHCGLKMQLTPLHTLVMVMYNLSTHGCDGEDLFGIIATLLCLLKNGADPFIRASLAIKSLLPSNERSSGHLDGTVCLHEEIDPLQLATTILSQVHPYFKSTTILGWEICIEILLHAKGGREDYEVDSSKDGIENFEEEVESFEEEIESFEEEDEISLCYECEHDLEISYSHISELGLLWAIVRAEMATYRRISIADSWTSTNLDLKLILMGLQTNSAPDIKLLRDKMIKPNCRCGNFFPRGYDNCITPGEACNFYFSNMGNWFRSTFLPLPNRDWREGWLIEEDLAQSRDTGMNNQEVMNDESGPVSPKLRTRNEEQANSRAEASGQTTGTTDQPMIDQFPDHPKGGEQYAQQPMDIDDPIFHGVASHSFMGNM
ncbi:MAG: hypothetical protein Q9160_007105 [Pyrenula sp. 1 TL-2023]